jgi:hypothetical protein
MRTADTRPPRPAEAVCGAGATRLLARRPAVSGTLARVPKE